MRKLENILVTGAAGFIGSNFVNYIFNKTNFKGKIINADKLTYAGNLENLKDVSKKYDGTRYFFEQVDICDIPNMHRIFKKYNIDTVINFSACTHVDRSIYNPGEFIQTNIIGTFNLLEVARDAWKDRNDTSYIQISTDEVFGSLGDNGYFYEETSYDPRSPYASSKASADHIVKAYYHTYNFPAMISNCSNNYGPNQFPEKLMPLMLLNIKEERPLPVYGDGKNIRDWLFVEDHCSAIWAILNKGIEGETYNIGGDNEWENIKLINVLCEKMARALGKDKDYYKKLITYVKDRPGHDRRYAICCDKIKTELGWKQSVDFDKGLDLTVDWYLNNTEWVEHIKTGEYTNWIDKNYAVR